MTCSRLFVSIGPRCSKRARSWRRCSAAPLAKRPARRHPAPRTCVPSVAATLAGVSGAVAAGAPPPPGLNQAWLAVLPRGMLRHRCSRAGSADCTSAPAVGSEKHGLEGGGLGGVGSLRGAPQCARKRVRGDPPPRRGHFGEPPTILLLDLAEAFPIEYLARSCEVGGWRRADAGGPRAPRGRHAGSGGAAVERISVVSPELAAPLDPSSHLDPRADEKPWEAQPDPLLTCADRDHRDDHDPATTATTLRRRRRPRRSRPLLGRTVRFAVARGHLSPRSDPDQDDDATPRSPPC